LQYTQAELAERLGVEHPEVSRLENQADMFVSTLRRFVEALGGLAVTRVAYWQLYKEDRAQCLT
jgi:transcriptional regulator with XRE-family HTH domain